VRAGHRLILRLEIGGSPLALNIGKDLPGGLPYQPWAAELVKQRFSKDDPHVRCLPDNPPRTWGMPHLTKAVHTPRLLVLLYEVNAMSRQIFIDGRPQLVSGTRFAMPIQASSGSAGFCTRPVPNT